MRKALATCSSLAPPPDVEEVCRLGAHVLGWMSIVAIASPAPFTHAADIAVEPDVVHIVLVGLDVERVFLAGVPERGEVGMPPQGILVEVHLGVGGEQPPVDVITRGLISIRLQSSDSNMRYRLAKSAPPGRTSSFGEAECGGGVPPHVRLEADDGVDGDARDLLRRARRNLFNVHAAGLADDEDGAALRRVDGDGGVELLRDADRLLDDHAVPGTPSGPVWWVTSRDPSRPSAKSRASWTSRRP